MITINCEDLDCTSHDSAGDSIRKGIGKDEAFFILAKDSENLNITFTNYKKQENLDRWLSYLRTLGFRIRTDEIKLKAIDIIPELDKLSKEDLMELAKEILNRL